MLVWPGSSKLGHGISKMVRHVTSFSYCAVGHLLDILIHWESWVCFQKGVSVFKLIGFHLGSACLLQLNNTIDLHPVSLFPYPWPLSTYNLVQTWRLCIADNLHDIVAVEQLVSMWRVCTYALHVHIQFLLASEHPIADAYLVITWQM